MSLLSIALASVLLTTSVYSVETTNATCSEDLWTITDGVSPCELAIELEGACFNNNFNLPALPVGDIYNGPLPGTSNTCQCSSVTYSVVQACAACQGRSFAPWDMWIANCDSSQISIGSYPVALSNVSVPAWAFLNVTKLGVFDVNSASAIFTQPASTLSPTGTSGTSSPSGSNTSAGAASSKSSNHTGAIVGGVIGGLVAIALIIVGVFFVMRRRRAHRRIQPRVTQEKVDMTQNSRYTDTYSLAPPRLYDPADPTTFPQSPAPTFFTSSYTTSTPPPGHKAANSSGSYSGIPEL